MPLPRPFRKCHRAIRISLRSNLDVPAIIFSICIAIAVLFQFALAFGAPWGHLAMGGRFPGKFPTAMRISAVVQAIFLSLLAVVVLVRSHIMLPRYYEESLYGIWVVVGISALSFIMNLATPMKWERIIWAPIGGLLLACSLLIALS